MLTYTYNSLAHTTPIVYMSHCSLFVTYLSDYTDFILGLAVLNQETINPVLFTIISVIMNCTER